MIFKACLHVIAFCVACVVAAGAQTLHVIARGYLTDEAWTDAAVWLSWLSAIVCGGVFWLWAMKGIENDTGRN